MRFPITPPDSAELPSRSKPTAKAGRGLPKHRSARSVTMRVLRVARPGDEDNNT